MIDPASIGDWAQASIVMVTLAGAGVLFVRALRAEESEQWVPARAVEIPEVEPFLDGARLAAV